MNIALTVLLADTWGMHGDDVGWGWMLAMMLVMVLFWAAVIVGIVWLVRGGFDGWRGGRRAGPTEILERRFAEGAISVEDYRERREIIATGAHPRRETGGGDEPPAPGTSGREES